MAAGRAYAVDLLKLAMALLVVGIHANPFADLGRTAILLTGEGFYRLAVPVFLVFNGYFLHAAIVSGRSWRVVRHVLALYLIWMALYLPVYWKLLMGLEPWRQGLLLALGYWHLWYLMGLAIAAALLVALRQISDRALFALAGLTWAIGAAIPYLRALDLISIPDVFADPLSPNRNALFLCLPYAALGLLMARQDWPAKVSNRAAGVAALVGIAAVVTESLLLARLPQSVSHDTLASLALAAPALALWALTAPGAAQTRLTADLANGLYFLHVGFVALLFRHTDLSNPVVWLLAVAGSVVVTLVLRRTGLARHLL
ncbi:acyltransferase family protein [Neotabrizicola sp. sgz301269]|uniref:acyltransferase family protein n=1 Tax=Neotabrizicola sp. sgz301269 TaxID=3276282 RepID=UPI0037702AF0